MDRHDEQQVELVKKWFEQGKRRRRVERQTPVATSVSNLLQGFADIVFCFRFNMNRNRVDSCIDETSQIVISMLDHQVNIKRQTREFANGRDHSRAKRNVIDEMTVHDVAMDPIGSGPFDLAYLIGQSGKICGWNRRRNQHALNRVME